MFTGIIQTMGRIKSIDKSVFYISAQADFLSEVDVGDSIAVNGVCLTVTQVMSDYFSADVSQETRNCSIFATASAGDTLNLEKSLRLNQGIDGHIVSGHVDGIAQVVDKFSVDESTVFKIRAPQDLVKYIARKGSVCLNGVSLTVNKIESTVFDINIVPHTLLATTLGKLNIGSKANLEVDMIARHLEQLLNKD